MNRNRNNDFAATLVLVLFFLVMALGMAASTKVSMKRIECFDLGKVMRDGNCVLPEIRP